MSVNGSAIRIRVTSLRSFQHEGVRLRGRHQVRPDRFLHVWNERLVHHPHCRNQLIQQAVIQIGGQPVVESNVFLQLGLPGLGFLNHDLNQFF